MVRVHIEAAVNATEDPAKVVQAVRQMFPDAEVEVQGGRVIADTDSLETLLRKAREERVRDAARGTLWRGRQDDHTTRFQVNKQAAYVGRVNFNEVAHPLGDLEVTVETDDLDALLSKIAPPTRAELHADRTTEFRAAIHKEEGELARMGSAVETGFEDEPGPADLDPWSDDEAEGEEEDEETEEAKRP